MAPFRLLVLLLILLVLGVGLHDYLHNFEKNDCEMTYMYSQPQYLRIPLDTSIQERYPSYGLYFYGEGKYAEQSLKSGFRLNGIPVLFIPGNAGSYRQVRSLGSVALRKADDAKTNFHFNYFSLDFNEEFSGLYGQSLYDQTNFTYECIKKIMSLYKGSAAPPKSVVLVGHSMGGMVARALFTLPDFKPELVNTIITQATPHQRAPVTLDYETQQFYDVVNSFWKDKINTTVADVTVFSTAGGHRDILVRSGLTALNGIVKTDRALSANTMSVPRAWVSTDHLCHVWCKQIVLATKRALFDVVDKSTKQIAVSPFYRWSVFLHHFHKNPGIKPFKGAYDKSVALDKDIKWEIRKKLSWKLWKASLSSTRYSVTEIPASPVPAEYSVPEWGYVAVSNIENVKWLGTCSTREKFDPSKPVKSPNNSDNKQCAEIKNQAPYADLLPPLYSEKKVIHLDHEILKDSSHIVTVLPKTKKRIELYSELYRLEERHLNYNTTGVIDFFLTFPRSITEDHIIVNSTAPGAIFYNISLDLEIPLQAYTANLITLDCTEEPPAQSSGAVMKLFVPWSHDHTYKFVSGKSMQNGSLPLKLMIPKPSNVENQAQLHLYLLPTCTYRLSISTAWAQLFGQFVRFYGLCIPGFVVIQVLMVLSWQLKMLDEQGHAPSFSVSHARWAQPYRVVPVSLLLRFMLYYPEEDNIAMKLGIPRDDRVAMENLGIWYAALPIMLYLSTYAAIGLYGPFVHVALSTAGRVIGAAFRFLAFPRVQIALSAGQYVVYVMAACLSASVCGTLGIILVYSVTVLKTIGLSVAARSHPTKDDKTWTHFNIHISLVLLLLATLVLHVAPLLMWATKLEHSLVLAVDPSRTVGVVVAVVALMLSLMRFPSHTGEMYGIASAMVYITCVLMVLYTVLSVYRIGTFIYAALIVICTCALLSVWLERNRPRETPAVREKPDEKQD